jgi:HTH-type transcriptional regulator / antitoxin HigA
MSDSPIILNEREARRARAFLARVDDALSSPAAVAPSRYAIPAEVWDLHERALRSNRRAAASMLSTYDEIKEGNQSSLVEQWKREPGVILIIARIARGLSQLELAERLGMREQQIQRYEAERYRTISLQNMRRLASALGVNVEATLDGAHSSVVGALKTLKTDSIDDRQMTTIIAHAKKHRWLSLTDELDKDRQAVVEFIEESASQYGSPGLLRTGLKSLDLKDDALLAAWRARVLFLADEVIKCVRTDFDPIDLHWVGDLVKMSSLVDGPKRAIEFCRQHGIVVVVEPQIQGLKLDGAAFLRGTWPVIGLTIRHDRIDNFWYTLLHELGHIFLHYNSGLASGFFDDEVEAKANDELEQEADSFASAMLIPPERWRQSLVRVTRSAAAVEQFAKQIGIHPAIVFGRIRRERNEYRLFSDQVGSGQVWNTLITS